MLWKYKGLDKDGNIVEGEREAATRFNLIETAKAEGLILISVSEDESSRTSDMPFGIHLPWLSVQPKTITNFTRQMADLMDAGIPVAESIRSLSNFESSQRFSDVLDGLYKSILQGQGFSDALNQYPHLFSKVYVSLVRVGETTGRLPEVLSGLADFRERDDEIRGKIKGALSYPLFTLVFSMVLCWAMISYVLPGFVPIWQGSGLNLHQYPVTEGLLALSALSRNIFDEILVLALVVGAYLLYRSILKTPEARHKRDSFIFKIPVVSNFVLMGIIARLCNTLGILVKSGISLVRAIDLAADTVDNAVFQDALRKVSRSLQEGMNLSDAVLKAEVFPSMMVQMIGVSEQSGGLDEMLPRTARYYDRQLELSLKTISALMEPMTMILVGGVVGLFVIGIFLPIMGIVQALQSQM